MIYSTGLFPLNSRKPLIQFIISLMIILVVSVILLIITLLSAKLIFGTAMIDSGQGRDVITIMERACLKYVMALQHISIFVVPSLIISHLMDGNCFAYLRTGKLPGGWVILFAALISLLVIPVNSDVAILNSRLTLPEWMSGIEKWIILKEDEAFRITGWLIYAKSNAGLALNIIVLALLPAIGEEFIFRGIFQQIFHKWFRSGHLAVWVTAIIFSAVHLQFFGFLPRLILGLLFGYLFLWSGSIWLPVLAHFINNAIPVIVAFFTGWDNMDETLSEFTHGSGYSVIIPILLISLLLFVVWDMTGRTNFSVPGE